MSKITAPRLAVTALVMAILTVLFVAGWGAGSRPATDSWAVSSGFRDGPVLRDQVEAARQFGGPTPPAWIGARPEAVDPATLPAARAAAMKTGGRFPAELQWHYLDGAEPLNTWIDSQLLQALDEHNGTVFQPVLPPGDDSTVTAAADGPALQLRSRWLQASGDTAVVQLSWTRTAAGTSTSSSATAVYRQGHPVAPFRDLFGSDADAQLAMLLHTVLGPEAPKTRIAGGSFDEDGNLHLDLSPGGTWVTISADAARPILSDLGRHVQDGAAAPFSAPPAPAVEHVNCDLVPCVALTYDDGPTEQTGKLLNILQRHDAGATFFALGEQAAEHPALARDVSAAGFFVENHSWSHPDLRLLAPEDIAEEIESTTAEIAEATGREPTLLRAPYGGVDDRVRAAAGLPLVGWSVDAQDWLEREPEEYRRMILDQVAPGGIILQHDIHSDTVERQDEIIRALLAKGYHLVSVHQLFEGIELRPGQTYSCRGTGAGCTPGR